MATLDTIKDILQENLDIAPENVDEDSTFESLGVDSLDMVELICELEERLDVDFRRTRRSRDHGRFRGIRGQPVIPSNFATKTQLVRAGSFGFVFEIWLAYAV